MTRYKSSLFPIHFYFVLISVSMISKPLSLPEKWTNPGAMGTFPRI